MFEAPHVARIAVSILSDAAYWRDATCWAWVLMPDHWHGLIQLQGEAGLSKGVGRLKGGSAYRLGRAFPRLRPVWQDAFHDHALRREEDEAACVRYLLDNPVRAGLAASAEKYPYHGEPWADACLYADVR